MVVRGGSRRVSRPDCIANHFRSFTVSLTGGVDSSFYSFARLLLDDQSWAKARRRAKLPTDQPDAASCELLRQVINDRLSRYLTTLIVSHCKAGSRLSKFRLDELIRAGGPVQSG